MAQSPRRFCSSGLASPLATRSCSAMSSCNITGTIKTEPDAVSEGFGFAPRLLVSRDALKASGLIQTGSLVEHVYKIRMDDPAERSTIRDRAAKDFPSAGWSIRTSDRAAPSLTENIERFSQFLTLVGLTALIVGGVGVANAVRAFLDSKRTTIATFKCLGAPAATVVLIYLFQIAIIALGGMVIGLVIGALAPIAGVAISGAIPAGFHRSDVLPREPVARRPVRHSDNAGLCHHAARTFPRGSGNSSLPRTRFRGARAALLALHPSCRGSFSLPLAGLAIVTAYDRFIAIVFVGAIAFAFVILRLVAAGIAWLARRSPRVNSPALRLAIGNIHRPGALTSSVVLSLGLGLALLVTLTLIDGNMRRQLTGRMAAGAPNFFFVDIQGSELEKFRSVIKARPPDGKLGRGADAARPHPRPQRRGRDEAEGSAGRPVGPARRPRHHIFGNTAGKCIVDRGFMVAEGL